MKLGDLFDHLFELGEATFQLREIESTPGGYSQIAAEAQRERILRLRNKDITVFMPGQDRPSIHYDLNIK